MPKTTIGTSLETTGLFALDEKRRFKDLDAMRNNIQINAFKYYEDMIVDCISEHKRYVWRETKQNELYKGVLDGGFVYPDGLVSDGIDYSQRSFNFYQVPEFIKAKQTEINESSDRMFVIKPNGSVQVVTSQEFSQSLSKETITIEGVEYRYKNNSVDGTAQVPKKFDIAEYGVRTITEDGSNIIVMQTLSYSEGTPTDLSSWVILSEVEL